MALLRPDLWLTVVDPHRADHALRYYPGEINVRLADVIVINKIDTASFEQIEVTRRIAHALNPTARVVDAASPVTIEDGEAIRGKRVLVVEDGPTITHGEMAYGAGWVVATKSRMPSPSLSVQMLDSSERGAGGAPAVPGA